MRCDERLVTGQILIRQGELGLLRGDSRSVAALLSEQLRNVTDGLCEVGLRLGE